MGLPTPEMSQEKPSGNDGGDLVAMMEEAKAAARRRRRQSVAKATEVLQVGGADLDESLGIVVQRALEVARVRHRKSVAGAVHRAAGDMAGAVEYGAQATTPSVQQKIDEAVMAAYAKQRPEGSYGEFVPGSAFGPSAAQSESCWQVPESWANDCQEYNAQGYQQGGVPEHQQGNQQDNQVVAADYQQGYQQGDVVDYQQGYQQGHQESYQQGGVVDYQQGYQPGVCNDYQEAYQQVGCNDYQQGYQQGGCNDYQEGYNQGGCNDYNNTPAHQGFQGHGVCYRDYVQEAAAQNYVHEASAPQNLYTQNAYAQEAPMQNAQNPYAQGWEASYQASGAPNGGYGMDCQGAGTYGGWDCQQQHHMEQQYGSHACWGAA